MTERALLLNAFLPATELDDPDRFAGRSAQVRQLADSLHSYGSTPLIYGDRGLGKSSLALQLQLIAMGNPELLYELNAQRLALSPEEQYLTFYVTCTDATQDFRGLLQALVNSAESVENVPSAHGAHQLVDRVTRKKLTLKVFELESTRRYQTESQRLSYQDLNLEEKLVQLCELLTATYGHRVLFIIDELDRVSDTSGLASFLKAASSELLKFVLVGIATNVSDLLADHQSLERRLHPVRVPIMTPRELGQIVTKAEAYLSAEGVDISFSPSAIALLARVAGGFPWFVHVLGQQCLIDADSDSRALVDLHHVRIAVNGLVGNRLAQQFRICTRRQSEIRNREKRHCAPSPIGPMPIYRQVRSIGGSHALDSVAALRTGGICASQSTDQSYSHQRSRSVGLFDSGTRCSRLTCAFALRSTREWT